MGFTITVTELLAFLRSKGYTMQTGRGRHGTKVVKGKHRISIPMHGGTLAKGTARRILADAGYTPDDLMEWRRK
jgi:predicted RNA binding protein YcfA (HicA-like mRNA interferase family)